MLVMTDCGWYGSWESVSVCGRYRWERRRCRPWLGRLSSWSVIVGTNVVCTCCHCFVNLVKLVWLGCKIIVDIDIHKWGNMCISLELFSVCHMWLRVKRKPLLSRPTWSLADLGFTAIFLLSFIFYQPYAWRRVWFENPCLKSGVYPFNTNPGPKNHLFWWFCNLVATLTAYIFATKCGIHNRASALKTTRGLLRHFKMSWTLVHKRLKIGPAFVPSLRKFCILLHCQASQMEIS